MDILRCSKCSCYYPKNKHAACPSCNESKHSDSKWKHLTFFTAGLLICFAIGSFFSVAFSAVALGIIWMSYFITISMDFKKAANNKGYLYPDKIKKKIEDSKNNLSRGLERRGPNKVAYQTFTSQNSEIVPDRNNDDSFSEFNENLSVVWADNDLSIDFSYRDATGNRSRRSVLLSEVNINSYGDFYFTGYCSDSAGKRHFKVDRITSKIEFSGSKYTVDDFKDNILHL